MSDTVIRVENLSKSYTISHQTGERYTALRDVLANGVKSVASSVWRVAGSRSPHVTRHSPPTTEEFWALNDVSFEVKQGERVGIIGRNGAGKSTLLKILSRITEPTKGRVHIKGRVASLLEVGTGFHPELTGRENIYLNGAILGMSRDEIRRKFDEIVAFAEVEKFLDTPVKRYSSGMYVRLAFAVAAHLEPEILVVDEVLAVGDVAFQKKCLGKMEDVSKKGRTVFFVSHNMEAILRLCSRGIYLDRGSLKISGDVGTVTNRYLSEASYTSAPAVDVSGHKRPDYVLDSKFRIKHLRLIGKENQLSYMIAEPIQIGIEYEYSSYINGLRIGLGINTLLGQRLCTFHTAHDSNLLELGRKNIYLTIDSAQFKPGIYTIDIGARSGKAAHDTIMGILSFEVVSLDVTGKSDDDDNHGLVSIKHAFCSTSLTK